MRLVILFEQPEIYYIRVYSQANYPYRIELNIFNLKISEAYYGDRPPELPVDLEI